VWVQRITIATTGGRRLLQAILLATLGCAACGRLAFDEVDGPAADGPGAPDATVEGGGTALSILTGQLGGPGNVDGVGDRARLRNPSSVQYGGGTTLYVADTSNATLRKLDLATGALTTIAGSPGTAAQVDGIGLLSRLLGPQQLTLDDAGNLYFADVGGGLALIRVMQTGSGQVSTVAGSFNFYFDGVGTAAKFSSPLGVAWDAGNLYVADTGNHVIRRIDLATRSVSTLAGTAGQTGSANGQGAAARFNSPTGLAADHAGHLYVADRANNQIRAIDLATAGVTTLAGLGQAGSTDGVGTGALFNAPQGLALDGKQTLYVVGNNQSVRRLDVTSAQVTTITDGSAAFNGPTGISSDGSGKLYVADRLNHTVRFLAATGGAVTTLAGAAPGSGATDGLPSQARLLGPTALVSDGTTLYVSDNQTIRAFDIASGRLSTLAGTAGVANSVDGVGPAARFWNPRGLTLDGAGHLYVADTSSSIIRVLDLATTRVTTIAGLASTTGAVDALGPDARFNQPFGIAYTAGGRLYIADTGNVTIRSLDLATGMVSTVAGAAGVVGSTDGAGSAARFTGPRALAWDGAGTLYIADTDAHTVRAMALDTPTVTTLAGAPGQAGWTDGEPDVTRFNKPFGLAVSGGSLLVCEVSGRTLRRIDLGTGLSRTIAGVAGQAGVLPGPLPARMSDCRGVALLPQGAVTLSVSDENALLVVR
jgi:sugar lactone lactonase YvrE